MNIRHVSIFARVIDEVLDITKNEEYSEILWCGENDFFAFLNKIFSFVGIDIDTVIDNSINKIGISTENYTVYSYDIVKNKNNDAIYLICNTHADEIKSQLINMGIKSSRIYILYPITYTIQDFEENFRHEMYCNHRMTLLEKHNCMLEIMDHFDYYCKKNNIRYWLYDGTLIGAIRHKGFIPWDDDLDVAVPYEDYIKLISEYTDNKDYSLISWERTKDYEFQWAKLVDNNTRLLHFGNSIMGCYIDIFPLGGYPDNENEIKAVWRKYRAMEEQWNCYNILSYTSYPIEDKRWEMMNSLYSIPFDEANNVGIMRSEKQKPWYAPKKWFDSIDIEFEGRIYKAPAGYDEYLKMKYGDYMSVPPVMKREIHGFEAYEIDERSADSE